MLENEIRNTIQQYAINEFIEDLNHHISIYEYQKPIQPLISNWFNNLSVIKEGVVYEK